MYYNYRKICAVLLALVINNLAIAEADSTETRGVITDHVMEYHFTNEYHLGYYDVYNTEATEPRNIMYFISFPSELHREKVYFSLLNKERKNCGSGIEFFINHLDKEKKPRTAIRTELENTTCIPTYFELTTDNGGNTKKLLSQQIPPLRMRIENNFAQDSFRINNLSESPIEITGIYDSEGKVDFTPSIYIAPNAISAPIKFIRLFNICDAKKIAAKPNDHYYEEEYVFFINYKTQDDQTNEKNARINLSYTCDKRMVSIINDITKMPS
jgi:hypothetical protein